MFDRLSYEDLFRTLPNRRQPLAAWQQLIPTRQSNPRQRQATRIEKPLSRTNSPQRQGLSRRKTTHTNQRPSMQHLTPQASEQPRALTLQVNRPASWHPTSTYPVYNPQGSQQLAVHDNNTFLWQHPTLGHVSSYQPTPAAISYDNNPYGSLQQPYNGAAYSHMANSNSYNWNSQMYYNPANPSFIQQPPDQSSLLPHSTDFSSYLFDSNASPQSTAYSTSMPRAFVEGHQLYGSQESENEDSSEEIENDLVGMGLYETPEKTITLSNGFRHPEQMKSGKGLKLEEAWEPSSTSNAESDDEAEAEAEGEDDTELESLVADDASQRNPSFEQERVPSFNASLDYTAMPTQMPITMPYALPPSLNDYSFYFENADTTSPQDWFQSEFQKVSTKTDSQSFTNYNWI